MLFGPRRVRSWALGLYKEQHRFLYKSHPDMANFHDKSQHRSTTASTVAVAVAAPIDVSCSNLGARGVGGCLGASWPADRQSTLRSFFCSSVAISWTSFGFLMCFPNMDPFRKNGVVIKTYYVLTPKCGPVLVSKGFGDFSWVV